ncbi:MAG: rod shape-determining protein, partial [Aquificaceae bacterium]|nr:rod shape-determining protein [Aquificaceae bacterium]
QIRLEEIMEKLTDLLQLQNVDLNTLHAGIVITGGSAKLAGMKEFLERYFDMPVRIGYPIGVTGLKEKVRDPAYATAVGLIKLAHRALTTDKKVITHRTQEGKSENTLNFSNLIAKVKTFLRDII